MVAPHYENISHHESFGAAAKSALEERHTNMYTHWQDTHDADGYTQKERYMWNEDNTQEKDAYQEEWSFQRWYPQKEHNKHLGGGVKFWVGSSPPPCLCKLSLSVDSSSARTLFPYVVTLICLMCNPSPLLHLSLYPHSMYIPTSKTFHHHKEKRNRVKVVALLLFRSEFAK